MTNISNTLFLRGGFVENKIGHNAMKNYILTCCFFILAKQIGQKKFAFTAVNRDKFDRTLVTYGNKYEPT